MRQNISNRNLSLCKTDDGIEVFAEWQLFLELVAKHDLVVYAKMECMRLYYHDSFHRLHISDRLNFIEGLQPIIALAEIQKESAHGNCQRSR